MMTQTLKRRGNFDGPIAWTARYPALVVLYAATIPDDANTYEHLNIASRTIATLIRLIGSSVDLSAELNAKHRRCGVTQVPGKGKKGRSFLLFD